MADVRSMLRAERLSRAQDVAATKRSTDAASSKKRKASSLDSPTPDERKKARSEEALPIAEDRLNDLKIPEASKANEMSGSDPEAAQEIPSTNSGKAQSPSAPAKEDKVIEDELAAFERELAEMEASQLRAAASTAVLSAAPMTAQEIAAQAREEQSTQRGRKDEEMEAEKEEAARSLEIEFEAMEDLEDRVKKLRDRREALRRGGTQDEERPPNTSVSERAVVTNGDPAEDGEDEGEGDDDEEDEEYDDWTFGRT